jgi:acetyl-CoA acetyltransferase family protein
MEKKQKDSDNATVESTSKPKESKSTKSASEKTLSGIPVIVDGVRTPFVRSNGQFGEFESYDLGRIAMAALLEKTELSPEEIDHVIYGTVIHNPPTSNVARECMLSAGISNKTPAHTVALACISSNVAATSAADMIQLGRIKTAIIGGTDTCSDPPIRVSRNIRQAMIRLQKAKTPGPVLKEISKLSLKDLVPELPAVAEFSNGLTMGQGCERMAQSLGITRQESDEYASMSHANAIRAQKEGFYAGDIVHVYNAKSGKAITQDDGPREDTTVEKLSTLKPAFDKNFGIVTAGSASFLTDGASAVLMMDKKHALERGYKPLAELKDYIYVAGDPLDEMLLGPALAVPQLMQKNNLKVSDIDVWEIHEAFAAQMCSFFKCFESEEFAQKRLGLPHAFGKIPMNKLNVYGGSLSLGHPFGATGGRLLLTASRRLQREKGRYAIVAGCAAGGHGSAILLEIC